MLELIQHPATAAKFMVNVAATLERRNDELHLVYGVEADPANLLLPPPAKPYRTDELWLSTCFELFITSDEGSYLEFNFSPSGEWAAYRFDSYRGDMQNLSLDEPPSILCTNEGNGILLIVRVRLRDLRRDARVGISAIIEEVSGAKSYWALAHPPGAPDFHDPSCFLGRLPE